MCRNVISSAVVVRYLRMHMYADENNQQTSINKIKKKKTTTTNTKMTLSLINDLTSYLRKSK